MKSFYGLILFIVISATIADESLDLSKYEGDEVLIPPKEYLASLKDQSQYATDGYRYKTVRRLRQRKRREVSTQYLPPVVHQIVEHINTQYLPPVATLVNPVEEYTLLADDGYRYKTLRRLRSRKRRDVAELLRNEYLAPVGQYLPPVEEVSQHLELNYPETELSDDGYRYQTVRRLRHRRRRDVSEPIYNEYLPPFEESLQTQYLGALVEPHTVLTNDGYRYKTVKKFKIRRH